MGNIPIRSSAIAFAAQKTEYTIDELEEIVGTMQTVMAPKLGQLYYDAWLRNKQNYLANLEGDIVAFGFPKSEWAEFFRDELSTDEIEVGILAHQYNARNNWGFAVRTNPPKLKEHYPLFVKKEGDAEMGEEIVSSHFARLMKMGASPAEAVDFWLCEKQNWKAGKVARWRGVSREAVNKNVRQAKGVFGDYDDAVDYYEEKNIEGVPLYKLDQPEDEVAFEEPGSRFRTAHHDRPEKDEGTTAE